MATSWPAPSRRAPEPPRDRDATTTGSWRWWWCGLLYVCCAWLSCQAGRQVRRWAPACRRPRRQAGRPGSSMPALLAQVVCQHCNIMYCNPVQPCMGVAKWQAHWARARVTCTTAQRGKAGAGMGAAAVGDPRHAPAGHGGWPSYAGSKLFVVICAHGMTCKTHAGRQAGMHSTPTHMPTRCQARLHAVRATGHGPAPRSASPPAATNTQRRPLPLPASATQRKHIDMYVHPGVPVWTWTLYAFWTCRTL